MLTGDPTPLPNVVPYESVKVPLLDNVATSAITPFTETPIFSPADPVTLSTTVTLDPLPQTETILPEDACAELPGNAATNAILSVKIARKNRRFIFNSPWLVPDQLPK
jgi:hypothetical protein